MKFLVLTVLLWHLVVVTCSEECAKEYLLFANEKLRRRQEKFSLAEWKFSTNCTDHNMRMLTMESKRIMMDVKECRDKILQYDSKNFSAETRRQILFFIDNEDTVLPDDRYDELQNVFNEITKSIAEANVTSFHNSNIVLHVQDIEEILSKTWNPAELKHLWLQWRAVLGPRMRQLFIKVVDLKNEAAISNGFKNYVCHRLALYDTLYEGFYDFMDEIWSTIEPFYKQLHAYVRYKLRDKYGSLIPEFSPIPIHLIGTLYADNWLWLYNTTAPSPSTASNVRIGNQKVSREGLYRMADEFYTQLNMSKVPKESWNHSIFEKTQNVTTFCNPRLYSFMPDGFFRIVDCASHEVLSSLYMALRMLGIMQSHIQSMGQPFIFQKQVVRVNGIALGNLARITTESMTYRSKLGYRTSYTSEDDFNNLYFSSLEALPFIINSYIVFKWRWAAFDGKVSKERLNCHWWELVENIQGYEPPVNRSEEDFDPSGQIKVMRTAPYLDYFLGTIAAYQLHRSLCIHVGQFDPESSSKPLHKCNLNGIPEVGRILSEALKYGSSKPWHYSLEYVTGTNRISAKPFLEYFQPLMDWLVEENKRNQEVVGWNKSERVFCT